MQKTGKINILAGIIFAGFIIAVIYHYVLGTAFNLKYPYNTFLFYPQACFSDFTDFYRVFKYSNFNPYVQTWYPGVNYFPFGEFVPYLFTKIPVLVSLTIFMFGSITYYGVYNFINIKKNLLENKASLITKFSIISFLSYPFLIWYDRANFEIFIFIFLSLSVYFFTKKNFLTSALILSIPIAIKGFPILFLILFLKEKKYKEIFYCLLLTFILTVMSIILMEGDFVSNIIYYKKHLNFYISNYAINNSGLGWGSSLFSAVKLIIFGIKGLFAPIYYQLGNTSFYLPSLIFKNSAAIIPTIAKSLNIFNIFAVVTILSTMCYIFFIEKELWKQILLIIICAIIFMPVSGDYKLLHLYIPLWLFINAQNPSKTDLFYTILFGLILIPKSYIQVLNPLGYNHFSISILLNPLILLAMLVIVVAEGSFKKRYIQNLK
jgi:hypothetical protein